MKGVHIHIPMWPLAKSLQAKLGTEDYGHHGLSCDSFRIPLRARAKDPKVYTPDYHIRAWQDIGMTIFVCNDKEVSIDLKAMSVHSADIAQLEHLVKCLKWVDKVWKDTTSRKSVYLQDLPFFLMHLCSCLGITHCVQYTGINQPDVYAPVSEVLGLICEEAQRRWERIK